jgi:hypothetical protein
VDERVDLKQGQWFTYPLDRGIPSMVRVYSGTYENRKSVATISKMQALALARWYGHSGIYFSVRDGNDRWKDVRLVGDIEAWYGDGDAPASAQADGE